MNQTNLNTSSVKAYPIKISSSKNTARNEKSFSNQQIEYDKDSDIVLRSTIKKSFPHFIDRSRLKDVIYRGPEEM